MNQPRLATKEDMPRVLELINELAVFEKEPDAVVVTVEDLVRDGFGDNPKFKCFVLEDDPITLKWLKTYWQKELSELDRKVLAGSILGITGIMLAAVFQCYWTDLENNIAWWFTGIMGAQVFLRHQ